MVRKINNNTFIVRNNVMLRKGIIHGNNSISFENLTAFFDNYNYQNDSDVTKYIPHHIWYYCFKVNGRKVVRNPSFPISYFKMGFRDNNRVLIENILSQPFTLTKLTK